MRPQGDIMPIATPALAFGFAAAARLARENTPRLGGESLTAYQLRLDNRTCVLLRASVQAGSLLHRFLHVTHAFTTPDKRDGELRWIAAETLRRSAPVKAAPDYALEAMRKG